MYSERHSLHRRESEKKALSQYVTCAYADKDFNLQLTVRNVNRRQDV